MFSRLEAELGHCLESLMQWPGQWFDWTSAGSDWSCEARTSKSVEIKTSAGLIGLIHSGRGFPREQWWVVLVRNNERCVYKHQTAGSHHTWQPTSLTVYRCRPADLQVSHLPPVGRGQIVLIETLLTLLHTLSSADWVVHMRPSIRKSAWSWKDSIYYLSRWI